MARPSTVIAPGVNVDEYTNDDVLGVELTGGTTSSSDVGSHSDHVPAVVKFPVEFESRVDGMGYCFDNFSRIDGRSSRENVWPANSFM